ncbi:WD40 repeat domain-containing protein [Hydrogenimonas sp.]
MRGWAALWGLLLALSLHAASYRLHESLKIPGALFFTPAASSERLAAFGYLSKAKPTPEEIAAEKRRIQSILENSIAREYGGWEGYEEAMKKAGEEAAKQADKEEPSWAKALMPPSLIEEAVPFFMKGALMWVMAHPEARTEPFGNVGETGVVLLEPSGRYVKVPLGINQPVVSLDISPDGRYVAALGDMSTEDEKGRLHTMGRVSLIDTKTRQVVFSAIFANATDEVRFSPDGRSLALLLRDPKDWSRMAVRFLEVPGGRLQKGAIYFKGFDSTQNIHGKTRRLLRFRFTGGGRALALFDSGEKGLVCYNLQTKTRIGEAVRGSGPLFGAAHTRPWLLDARGRLFRCGERRPVFDLKLPRDLLHEFVDVAFTPDDTAALATDWMGCLYRIDPRTGRYAKSSCRLGERAGLFFLFPDGRTLAAFREVPKEGFVRFGPLKRKKVELRLFDTASLRPLQALRPSRGTVVDAAAANETLFLGNFDTIDIYTKE